MNLWLLLVPHSVLHGNQDPALMGGGIGDESWDDESCDFEDSEDFHLDLPDEIRNVEDAKRTIAGIKSVAVELSKLSAEHENVKKAAEDLTKAVSLLQANSFDRGSSAAPVGTERDLSQFVSGEDLAMLGSERSFEFAGQTHKVYQAGLLDGVSVCAWQEDLKKMVTQRNLARLCQKQPHTPNLDSGIMLHLSKAPSNIRGVVEKHVKKSIEGAKTQKAFGNTSGYGAEWIPEQFVPDLYEAMQVRGEIRGQFGEITIISDSFRRPRVSNVTRPYNLSQITSDNPSNFTASTPTTGEQSYTVPGLAVRTLADVAATEDSAIAAAARISRMLIESLDDGVRDTVINGDTTATHEDAIESWNLRSRWGSTGLGGAADHRRVWKGLRRQAVDRSNTLDMGSLQTAAGVLQLISMLGERGAGQLRMFTSPEVVIQKLMALTEVLTIDKFGARASIVTGQIADLFGIPIIPTRFMGADLASTGLYTATGSKSGLIVVDTSAYYFINRRAEMVETQKIIQSQHLEIVASVRLGFDTPDDSSADNVAYGYNWL